MDLLSIFKEFLAEEKTGQLVIKFEGESRLCKVHIDNGKALYISIGNKNPDETIKYISGKQPVEADFIEGVPPVKRLNEPLNNKLLALAGAEDPGISTQSRPEVGDIDNKNTVPPQVVE